MTVRMRHTRGHSGNRRSHHALSEVRLSKCKDCGVPHQSHKICENCGKYNGRLIIDIPGKTAKRLERRNAKLKSMGEENKKPEEDEIEAEKSPKKASAK